MTNRPPDQACWGCSYFDRRHMDDRGICRSRAPIALITATADVETIWHKVPATGWCPSFESREQALQPVAPTICPQCDSDIVGGVCTVCGWAAR